MATPTRGALLREGKSKVVYAVAGDDAQVILHYRDDATAFNGVEHALINDKGAVNAALNWHLMRRVEGEVLPYPMIEFFLKDDDLGDLSETCREVYQRAFGQSFQART
jgi:phosphoribosylaminoimidazole-succinocarboxamide synthase